MNRLAAIVIPPAMGVIADHWGAGQSFVILGAILIVLCAPVTLITRRAARTVTQAEPTLSDEPVWLSLSPLARCRSWRRSAPLYRCCLGGKLSASWKRPADGVPGMPDKVIARAFASRIVYDAAIYPCVA